LIWHETSKSFRTKVFDRDLQIGLYLPDLELYFCENEVKVPHSFWLDDRTPAYVEAWYLVELVHRDRDRDKFSTELPFDSPNMLMGDTEDHNASAFIEELAALQHCFEKAIIMFDQVAGSLLDHGVIDDSKNALVLKPESFALTRYFCPKITQETLISIGFSAGDNLRPSPFFFASAVPKKTESPNHILDYNAEKLISLDAIQNEKLSNAALVERLHGNVLGLIDS